MPSASPPERPSYKDAKGKPKWDIEEERKEEASNPGPLPTLVGESDDEGPPEALVADAPEACLDVGPPGNVEGPDTDEEEEGATDKAEPGGKIGNDDGSEEELVVLESINASSAQANKLAILEGDAHLQLLQETCLAKILLAAFDKDAKAKGKNDHWEPARP